ncbi:MAG TPA: methyltransferase domain-containing protein [Pyrinomonadaceae bacterium]|jgi:cyclopropane fatty-acyl-phospholipid synthase-like methyltransferase|nr:methyltransferase domain-containing protein [Pyrinomonadaceae bacterium]
MRIPDNWFESFFHGVTLELWRRAMSAEQTQAEAQFLIDHLKCGPESQALDVPCGNGRLSFELAQRGVRVTGVDISEEFIAEARSMSAPPAVVEFILSDMRLLEGDSIYDGAYCFGNSFAFLGHEQTEVFLRAVARVLKPGGRFVVETGMAAESVIPDFEEQSCHEMGDLSITIKERYIAEESCIDSEYIFERDGKRESRLAREWIYTVAELRRMLNRSGFEVLNLYGSLKGEPYKLRSRELLIVSETK